MSERADSASLTRQIGAATELRGVVRAMKALAASNISQFQAALVAVDGYCDSLELGLGACLRGCPPELGGAAPAASGAAVEQRGGAAQRVAIVIGSDQGLLGRYNDVLAQAVLAAFRPGTRLLVVGARVHALLCDAGLAPEALFAVPAGPDGLAPLVAQLHLLAQPPEARIGQAELTVYHYHAAGNGVYAPAALALLPLDGAWRQRIVARAWPARRWPEVVGEPGATLAALIGEYLYMALLRAAAESLAGENACRLAAMERADTDIARRIDDLRAGYNRLRQDAIDAELFDVVAAAGLMAPGRA